MTKALNRFCRLLIALCLFIASCKTDPVLQCDRNFLKKHIPLLTNIAFGSCSDQNLPQPILNTIVDKHPQLFIYLGDNIYGDSYNTRVLEVEYGKLSCSLNFKI